MRHRQHRQDTRDRLVFGLPADGGHAEGLAEDTDARPKKDPAVTSRSDAAPDVVRSAVTSNTP